MIGIDEMNKPKIKEHQYLVAKADYATGHIINLESSIFLGEGQVYKIFDAYDEAIEYMEDTVNESPNVECWAENSNGEHIITIDKTGYRKKNR